MASVSARRSRQRPTRSGSTFFGTIKNLVTAPLTWFSGEAETVEDDSGKRKHVPQPSYNLNDDDDDGSTRIKRMRVHSPERDVPYLDPPIAAFQKHQPRQSASAFARAPPKNGITRTMSVDPPYALRQQSSSRDITMESIPESSVYRREFTPMVISRDMSMPAISVKGPSFKMRTSLTPQPSGSQFGPTIHSRSERDVSEPPPLKALMNNPMFVRAPSEQSQISSSTTTTTLGSIAEGRRSSRTPTRQHSSLLFASHSETLPQHGSQMTASEKALHELDIYKTPLLPTRLRGSASIPDMFKPRKQHPIVLMDERGDDSRPGKNEHTVNESKPYAGAGGMKKMLAKRRMEEHDEGQEPKSDFQKEAAAKSPEQRPSDIIPPFPVVADPFQVSDPSSREQSSLRVGRSKATRNHARAVARPNKSRFSAAYEEDEGDDVMNDEQVQERHMLDEAATKAPVFNIPEGFKFSNEAPAIFHDSSNAKEPPITSLPFSLQKTNAPTSPPVASAARAKSPVSSFSFGDLPPKSTTSFSSALAAPTFDSFKGAENQPSASIEESKTSSSSVPNFFANSAALSKPIAAALPPFAGFPSTFAPSAAPVKDAENPFWEGEEKREFQKINLPASGEAVPTAATPTPTIFGSTPSQAVLHTNSSSMTPSDKPARATSEVNDVAPTPDVPSSKLPFLGGAAPSIGLQNATEENVKPVSTSFSFGQPPATLASTSKPSTSSASNSPFTFGQQPAPSIEKAAASTTSAFSFGQSPSVSEPKKDASKPAPFSFGQPPNIASEKIEPPKPSPFSFGSSSNSSTTAAPQAPTPTPFSFGAPPSTPPPATPAKPTSSFSFGSAATPTQPAFSFGSGAGGGDTSNKPFSFGSVGTPTSSRPITPPRDADNEVQMDESPTREVQAPVNTKSQEKTSFGGFNFGSNATGSAGSPFGAQSSNPTPTSTSSPFSFGSPAPAAQPNLFGSNTENKSGDKGPGFSFGQTQSPSTGSGFSFGQKTDTQPSGGFTFGATPSNSTTSSPFSFGNANNNPFGQQNQTSSAPGSPSTFNQQTPFTFGAAPTSTTSTSNPFAFGSSQPSSPAVSSTGLPQPPGSSGGFTFGSSGGSSAPFGTSPVASGGNGSLFTIGAAPTAPPPGANGARAVKRMPARRNAAKR